MVASAQPSGIAFAPVATRCTHCGETVPPGLIEPDAHEQFCCGGCRTAYSLIHSCGLDRYYALRDELERSSSPAAASGRTYAQFDDPVFRTLYVRTDRDGSANADLFLEGVHCAACVWLVERLPRIVHGVREARLDLRRSLVRISWTDAAVPLSTIASRLDALGYAPHPARDARSRAVRKAEDRKHLVRLGLAGACAGNAMLLALALYAGVFDAMEPATRALFRWTSMGVSLISLLGPGMVFFRGAWRAFAARVLNIDVPIALGLLAGGAWSVASTLRGTGEIYFDTLSVLVFALLIGRFIQHRQRRWAADAIELLFSLTPSSARRVEGGDVRDVPIEAITPGDVVEVRAGDTVPVDGETIEGESSIDQSLLTGETRPAPVRPGDDVTAGATNLSGRLLVRVCATGEHTRVGQLMRLVQECGRRRAPVVLFADRAAGWFVAGMLALAAATVIGWWRIDPFEALGNASALLIVTCPCALGLATPLSMTVALGRAAKRGMLIKGEDALQSLGSPGTMLLDKTGTLTLGKMSLVRWIGDEALMPLVASLEAESSHPIAIALARAAAPAALPTAGVIQTVGAGIEGRVGGMNVLAGSAAFVRSRGLAIPPELAYAAERCADEALTPVLVAGDGRVRALACVGDAIRQDSAAALALLRARGWRVRIVSGDDPRVVQSVARRLGIAPGDAIGGATPEEKLAIVNVERAAAPVVMVGDGVNDAAALSAANVGIAVHGGAEASLAAADVHLSRPGVGAIASLLDASRRTMRTIRVNLAASLLYNALAAGLAITGVLNPIIAAILMPVSSLTVLLISFRRRTFGSEP